MYLSVISVRQTTSGPSTSIGFICYWSHIQQAIDYHSAEAATPSTYSQFVIGDARFIEELVPSKETT